MWNKIDTTWLHFQISKMSPEFAPPRSIERAWPITSPRIHKQSSTEPTLVDTLSSAETQYRYLDIRNNEQHANFRSKNRIYKFWPHIRPWSSMEWAVLSTFNYYHIFDVRQSCNRTSALEELIRVRYIVDEVRFVSFLWRCKLRLYENYDVTEIAWWIE